MNVQTALWLRRVLEVLVAMVLILLALPVAVIAAIGSAMSLRATPLFAQERIGLDGRTFRFWKIRTLPVSVPAYVDKHQLDAHAIPAFCRMLRALHLDELPQLWLVVRGQMSLVGPRPEMQHLHERMTSVFAAERTSVSPGCTGLWQISESCNGLIGSAPEYDSFYVQNRTLRLDLWILYRTARKMTRLAAPISLDSIPAWTLPTSAVASIAATRGLERAHHVTADQVSMPASAGR